MAWPAIATQFVIWGSLLVVNRLAQYFGRGDDKKPPRPQDFDVARATDGTALPMIYGTCRIDSPVLVWWGNQNQRLLADGVTYTYGVDLLYVLGVPPYRFKATGTVTHNTRLRSMWWGDNAINLGGAASPMLHGQVLFARGTATMFGGQYNGGGLNVDVEFFDGRHDQEITSHPSGTHLSNIDTRLRFAGIDMTLVPGYRHQALVAILGTSLPSSLGIGESPRLPQISFEVENNVVGAGLGMPHDMNPAWVIHDIITSSLWKMNYPNVDAASFTAAATTLETELHGYSRVHYENEDARKVIQDILQQIDGVLYVDHVTGLVRLKLIRNDYVLASVPLLTMDNTIGRPQINMPSWSETFNQVIVTYTDRSRAYKQGSARAQKLANITINGNRIRSTTIDLPGITNADLASKVAARELNSLSRPFVSISCKVSREFYNLQPGDVVRVYWPGIFNGLFEKAFRVAMVDLGQLADGAISLTLVEDVFGRAVPGFGATAGVG